MGYISDEKLYAPFNKTKTLELDYVQKAKKIAERINKGEEVPTEELAEIRNAAIADRTNLKGDFVISCFLDALQQFNRWERGKMIRATNKEMEQVYRNYFTKKLTVEKFCEQYKMDRNKYYRIVNCNVKNIDKKAEMQELKDKIEMEYN